MGVFDWIGDLVEDPLGLDAQADANSEARKLNLENLQAALGSVAGNRKHTRRMLGKLKPYLLEDIPNAIQEGTDRARKHITRIGRGARQGILDRGRQTQADATQALIGSGRYSSSIAENLAIGISSSTSRDLMGVDDWLAENLAGFEERATGMEVAGLQGAASFYTTKIDYFLDLLDDELGIRGQTYFEAPDMGSPAADIAAIFGEFIPG